MKVHGVVRVPGDKSISHRALILAAMARGTSTLTGLLDGADVKSSARILRQLGAEVSPVRGGAVVRVRGRRFRSPHTVLDCGNSGTTARLVIGAIAGHSIRAKLTGDASLRRRPMRRVIEPLRQMGAGFLPADADALPLTVRGGRLHGITYASPVASAQVKSAILLAALAGRVPVTITEPWRSRDHTERLFVHLGLELHESDGAISYQPSAAAVPEFELRVPGDLSSAAFLVAAAVLAEGGELLVERVGANPTRAGFLAVLERMGAHVERLNLGGEGGEPVADLLVRPAALRGTEVVAAEIPSLVDEVPVLAVLASRAAGETVFRNVGELRVKESNRLELVAANLRAVGAAAEVRGDDLFVGGAAPPPRGRVETAHDHRLAMAFAVLGTVPDADVRLSERASVAISYPRFFTDLRRIRDAGRGTRGEGRVTPRVIAIDGPAASGKSSTAAEVAQRLGWAQLDSGALYRALTLATLDRFGDEGRGTGDAWSAQRILALAEELPVRLVLADNTYRPEVAGVDVEAEIRSERVTARVSEVAAIPAVREWVNAQQRRAVAEHPEGVVVDGRDIGTVVFPDAPLKIFLTAAPEERARRRLSQRGLDVDEEQVARESRALAARDRVDASRPVAPLRPARDAILLDSTALSLDEQVARVVALAHERLPG